MRLSSLLRNEDRMDPQYFRNYFALTAVKERIRILLDAFTQKSIMILTVARSLQSFTTRSSSNFVHSAVS